MKNDLTKSEIEEIFGIEDWNPSSSQISAINAAIQEKLLINKDLSNVEWEGVVTDICPGIRSWALEGIDNSDLNARLKLATQK